jgi:NAD-dependent dihydropyrimidine dehydrogenase PreA subunit
MPPLAPPTRQPPAASRTWKVSRLRVGFQVLLHLLLIGHVAAYYFLGWTSVGGIDFQDFFYNLLGEGVVTAAVIFTAGVYLFSFVFGRLFCSWGCHFGAFQDLAAWLLARLGWKAPHWKTRFLHWSPYLLLGFVFLWPNLERWLERGWQFRGVDLAGAGPWERLPGAFLSVVTFLACGAGLLLLLGRRGFCRFVCPYGALFRASEPLSPFKVRRVKPCAGGCSEGGVAPCTAACPTAIDVHQETLREGMVTSLDCVRCHLCIEACPQEALRYGAAPRAGAPPLEPLGALPVLPSLGFSAAAASAKGFTIPWWEEALVLAVALGTFAAADLVYGGHFLVASMALGEGLLALAVLRLLSRREVRLQGFVLRRGGLRLSGISLCGLFLLTLVPLYDAAAFKALRARGARLEARAEASGPAGSAAAREHLAAAARSFEQALARFPSDLESRRRLCKVYLVLGDRRALGEAEEIARRSGYLPADIENLRWVYIRFGQFERAEALKGSRR